MTHPYTDLPPTAYWRTAVSNLNPLETTGLWNAKISLTPQDKVVTFGSCFAQHISRALVRNGFDWFDAEPGPQILSDELRSNYNYGIFSARTGNIYTAKALLQWLEWAFDITVPPDEIWETNGRFFDPFRPAIEPGGFASAAEVLAARARTLTALRDCVTKSSVFVFTLGLTEAWENSKRGDYTYATCPGTNAGNFDETEHRFCNYDYAQVHSDLTQALTLIRQKNANMRVLLTVSPVPLTATAAGKHVLVSTTYSKSVLRAVAGQISDSADFVDYFPSYEIITAPSFRGMFYSPNDRTVSPKGVAFVMEHFMAQLGSAPQPLAASTQPPSAQVAAPEPTADDLRCEEEILDAFAPVSR